jgi:hypothetical protein
MKIKGALMIIKDPKAYSDKFKKQEFLLDTSTFNQVTGEKYSNAILVENVNDKIDLNPFQIGDVVEVDFYINGRFYDRSNGEGKGFIQSLSAFKIEAARNTAGEVIRIPLDQMEIPNNLV